MERQIATTAEQSARLLKCGVPAESADMSYQFIDDCVNNTDKPICSTPKEQYNTLIGYGFGDSRIHITPAFSLSALLSLLPKEIYDESGDSFYFSLAKEFPLSEEYGAAYIPCWDKGDAIVRKRDNSPIEACVQLIEWLAENGYKLNVIEKGE